MPCIVSILVCIIISDVTVTNEPYNLLVYCLYTVCMQNIACLSNKKTNKEILSNVNGGNNREKEKSCTEYLAVTRI